jgi:polyisoprenyl-teichoic acid--peptidoglycan teichoic acid transferase
VDDGGVRNPRREVPPRPPAPRRVAPPADNPARPVPPRRTPEPPPSRVSRSREPMGESRSGVRRPRRPDVAEHPADLRRPARSSGEPPTRPVPRTTAARREATPRTTPARDDAEAPTTIEPPLRGIERAGVPMNKAARLAAPPVPRRSVTRDRPSRPARGGRTLGSALLATAAATVVPGSGHLMLRHKRTGGLILAVFLLIVVALTIALLTAGRSVILENLLSTRVLVLASVGLVVAALAWIAVVIRTYQIARPRGLDAGRQAVGALVVSALCLVIAAPLGFAANLANSQRNLLDDLFGGGGGTSAAEAIAKPRLNILLVGSDAGPDRTGARTDTMMVASLDTKTARTTLFSLPRNIGYAQFPPGSPMAEKFPKGFHDAANPLSGDYLLNAVYAWGVVHPQDAPTTPTASPGLNLLHETVGYMTGLQLDYYVEVNMAGFASIIDALGGVTIDVGPVPLPIGGVLPNGRHVKPDGYVPAGVQQLDGEQALWFARSRRDSDDYSRMGRQRCLLQTILTQKSPADVLTNFQGIAAATTDSVATNIPQEVLPQLASLAGERAVQLDSVSFDPNLADPSERDGRFNTSRVDVEYMREVVQKAIAAPPPVAAPVAPTSAPATPRATSTAAAPTTTPPASAAPQSLATACG